MKNGEYRIAAREIMAKGWSSLSRLTVIGKRSDGREVELVREVADHGAGAAILAIDKERGLCLLVKQWRAGAAFVGHDDWMIEVCAGLLDTDNPEACVKREALEELGTQISEATHVCDCFSSPGALSERLSLFIGHYRAGDRISTGGGLLEENEDIEVLEMPLTEAYSMIETGKILDAKTVILLQYAKLQNYF